MSQYQQYKIKPDQFLTVASNVLYKTLLEAPRTDAKNLYKAIFEGKRVALIDVRMDDDSTVRFDLSLDHSEFCGERLNFKAFRDSLSGLVIALSENLRQQTGTPVFTEQRDGSTLFGVPGVTRESNQVNLLMLGIDVARPGSVLLKLQYIDPSQFEMHEQEAG